MAARYYAPGDVRYEQVNTPEPAPGELLVRIGAATTCGTDLKCLKRGHPVLLGNTFPAPFGHEGAGQVVKVGPASELYPPHGFVEGDRVVFANSAPCGKCYFCSKQQVNLCEHLVLLNGTYADYMTIPANIVSKNTYDLPADMPYAQASLTEPLAVSLRCVMETPVRQGDQVAVLGVGAIGQMIIRLATWKGATVTAFGRNPKRLAMATTFGQASHTVDLSQGFVNAEAIRQQYAPPHGFDVVIEAIGLPDSWTYAVQLARRGGTVHWFAGCAGGASIPLDTRRVHYDELRLMSLFHHTPTYFKQALDLQTNKKQTNKKQTNKTLDFTPLITHELPMAQFEKALALVDEGLAIKVALLNEDV
jgi:L-iditol 2-dehydrogenase